MHIPEPIRVLIVDDDEDDFVMARDLLAEQQHTPCRVEWASDPDEALRLIAERRHDVYLLDHRLGGTTGLELLRKAFGNETHAPVIMLTGFDDHTVDLEATMLGVTDFLIKDRLDSAQLERSIRYAVRHHAVLSELRETQERYSLAVRGANDGIWDWDLVTDTVYYGSRWKQILGHDEVEIGDSPDEWLERVYDQDLMGVRAAIAAHLENRTAHFESEHRIKHADGSYRWIFSRGVAVRDQAGRATRMAGSISDVTDRKAATERLRHDARHDSLTGLPNRTMFLDHLDLALSQAKRHPSYRCAVLFLDLNRFKRINDAFGHAMGDRVLVAVARRLEKAMREGDTVARLGGDEFTVLLHDIVSAEAAWDVAKRIQGMVSKPFSAGGRSLTVTTSIGITTSEPGSNASELLNNADIAMYEAKMGADDARALFTSSMRERVVGQVRVEDELRDAIEGERLRVFYQPIVDIERGKLTGLEALARWPSEAEREVSPIEFIPVAEETGLIRPLGRIVLREACARLSEWRADGLVDDDVTVSVNVSGCQLGEAGLLDDVGVALRESSLPARALRLEITEGTIMRDPERMPAALDELDELGVRAHIDDFGTGYSSLTFLRHFAGNTVKIDRSFISSIYADDGSAEIVRTIIGLARNLDLAVIAEGVETEEQLRKLRELGGRFAQGYLFAKPVDATEAKALLADWEPRDVAAYASS